MPELFKYVLLGGGLTSAEAAMSIREIDSEGSILIVGGEPHLPYDRPPLSKNLLQDPLLTVQDIASADDKFYTEKSVRVLTGISAEHIDRDEKTVYCSDGGECVYEKLLLATGSTPRQLQARGDGAKRVLYLRTYEDGVRLRESLDRSQSALLIGAGYISVEVAAACVAKGVTATIVEPKDQVWSKFASKTMGAFLKEHFEQQGVKFIFGDEVDQIDVDGSSMIVRTKQGRTECSNSVLAGIGVTYNTDLVKECGLDVDNQGRVRVDKTLRTFDPAVWAAGDYAVYFDDIVGADFNAEHYMNAKWQGAHVGRSMAGSNSPFSQVPYFFSDMGDLHMILRGKSNDVNNTRIIGDINGGEFVELYADESGVLKMAIAMNPTADDKKLDKLSNLFESLIRDRVKADNVTGAQMDL